jgi:hypothetical protein
MTKKVTELLTLVILKSKFSARQTGKSRAAPEQPRERQFPEFAHPGH